MDMLYTRSRHIKCYRAIALKLLTISRNGQTKVSVFEKVVLLDEPIFLSVEALKLRQGQLHFFKWNHIFFFDDIITDFKTNSATYKARSF